MKNINYTELNELAFDFLAGRYVQRENEQQSPNPLVDDFSKYLIDNFHNPSVLEIGCGSGFMLKHFFERGLRTTAIDISSEIIEVAKIRSPTTSFIHSDFLSYNFDNERFSGVFANSVLHLFPRKEIERFFDKVYSILERDGCFYLSTPIFNKSGEEIVKRGGENSVLEYRTKYTKEEFSYLKSSRFKSIEESMNEFTDSKENTLYRINVFLIK